jgi:hypothetical protein
MLWQKYHCLWHNLNVIEGHMCCSGKWGGTTTEIRLFAECLSLCRVLFVGHSAKKSLLSATLGKVLLLVTTTFTESRTLGTLFAECQTLGERRRSAKGRQQPSIADGRYLFRALDFGTRQRIYFLESCLAYIRQTMLCRVTILNTRQSIFLFFFFFQPNFFWFVPTLCRLTCSILA